MFGNAFNPTIALSVTMLTSGCFGGSTPPPTLPPPVENSFTEYLKKSGYSILQVPSSLESAGALVRISDIDGSKRITWISSLENCGVPDLVLFPKSIDGTQPSKLIALPGVDLQGKNNFNSNLLGSIPTLKIKADASILREYSQNVTLTDVGASRIDRLETARYLSNPLNEDKIGKNCLDAMRSQDAAVIVDSIFVKSGKISLVNTAGSNAKLDLGQLKKLIDVGGSGNVELTKSGEIAFNNTPIYIAIKDSFYVPATGTLGGYVGLRSANSDIAEATTKDH